MQVNRRLYRCRENRVIAGVASGVAEFFGLDPTLVRVLWFLSVFFYGLGLLLYIGLAIIVPLEPVSSDVAGEAAAVPEGHRHLSRPDGRWATIIGLGLILVGALALAHTLLPDLHVARFVLPAIAIGIGAGLIARSVRREPMQS
jgi:phage shock protein C